MADTSREVFSPCVAAAMYCRDALVAVGGFDEDYFCYVEDIDLGFRLRQAGHRCLYVPESVAHYVGSGASGGKHGDLSVCHGHLNCGVDILKNMPSLLVCALLPLHLLLNLVSVVWFVSRGKGKVIVRTKRDAIKCLPRMWCKRTDIQKKRRLALSEIWWILR